MGTLIHDTAFAAAKVLTERMEPQIQSIGRDEFQRETYEVIKAALEGFQQQKERESQRPPRSGRSV